MENKALVVIDKQNNITKLKLVSADRAWADLHRKFHQSRPAKKKGAE